MNIIFTVMPSARFSDDNDDEEEAKYALAIIFRHSFHSLTRFKEFQYRFSSFFLWKKRTVYVIFFFIFILCHIDKMFEIALLYCSGHYGVVVVIQEMHRSPIMPD